MLANQLQQDIKRAASGSGRVLPRADAQGCVTSTPAQHKARGTPFLQCGSPQERKTHSIALIKTSHDPEVRKTSLMQQILPEVPSELCISCETQQHSCSRKSLTFQKNHTHTDTYTKAHSHAHTSVCVISKVGGCHNDYVVGFW